MSNEWNHLRDLASRATPGPWSPGVGAFGLPSDGPDHVRVVDSRGVLVATLDYTQQDGANGEYIAAANPETVLGLLDEVKQLEDRCSRFANQLMGQARGMQATLSEALEPILAEREALRAKVERVEEALDRIVLPHQETGEQTDPSYREAADYIRAHMDGGSDE